MRAALVLLLLTAAILTAPAMAAGAAPGSLSLLTGPTHCVTLDPSDRSCVQAAGSGLLAPKGIARSPDGRTVAFVSPGAPRDPVVRMARFDPTSDAFSPMPVGGCLAVAPGTRGCTTVRATPPFTRSDPLYGGQVSNESADGLVFSPDGRSAYLWTGAGDSSQLTTPGSGSIVVLSRDPASGSLSPVPGINGCLTDDGSDGAGGACVRAGPLGFMHGLAVSPDGRSVYAAGQNVVLSYARDPATGALAPVGCMAPDDRPVAGCGTARGLLGPRGPLVSADGRSVYVGTTGTDASPKHRLGVLAFSRDATGQLAQLPGASGCVLNDGAAGCTQDPDLGSGVPIRTLALARDGQTLYAFNDGVRVLGRDPAGGLSAHAGLVAGLGPGALPCPGQTGRFDGCPPLEAGGTIDGAALSADGRTLVVSSADESSSGVPTDGLAVFAVNPLGGGLQQSGCLEDDGILYFAPSQSLRCATARASILAPQDVPGSSGLLLGEDNRIVVLAPGLSSLPATARVTRSATALLGVRCEAQAAGVCRGTVTLRAGDSDEYTDRAPDLAAPIARPASITVAPGHDATVALRLDQRGRDELRARGSLDVRVRVTAAGATGPLESEAADRLSRPPGGLLGGRRASACLPADALPLARDRGGRVYGRGVDRYGELYVYGCLVGRRARHLDAHVAEPTYVRPPVVMAGPFAAFQVDRSVINDDGTAFRPVAEVRVVDLRNGRARAINCDPGCGFAHPPVEVVLGPDGALAVLANDDSGGDHVVVLEPGKRPRTVVHHPGGGLSGLRLRGTKLSWVYRGRRQRSVPLR